MFNLCCLQQIYIEAKKGFEDNLNTKEKGVVLTKDDKAHGSLLIMNELIRSASIEGEVSRPIKMQNTAMLSTICIYMYAVQYCVRLVS